MSGQPLTAAEIDAAFGAFDSIYRAVAAERRGEGVSDAGSFDSYIVDTALSLSRQVRTGDLDQAACDQMIWGLILARGMDDERLEAGLMRVESRLHEQLRAWQRKARELTTAAPGARQVPSRSAHRPPPPRPRRRR